ncbi:uncharacterized protein [Cardiocondyla obscurior]|uniref:uncharacterized protein isoform X2 n=1 Tax=Cardiocondyla obscurior TaxID=286306 RepID=UPI00396568FD
MDSQISRSLPPLVEGKLRGSLRLIVSEVFWFETNPGDVTVLASWWGERDNAQFRPRDNSIGVERTIEDISQVYAIRTNLLLFKDYVKNCNAIELTIIAENTYKIVGRGYVEGLSKIFSYERYSQFIPILNSSGHKMGKLYVSLELMYSTKLSNLKSYQMETIKYGETEDKDVLLFDIDNLQYNEKMPMKFYSNIDDIEETKSDKINKNDTYRSVLKTKRQEFQEPKKIANRLVINKLIPQIVTRAQCLREAILKETNKEDSLQIKSCKEDSLILNEILSDNELPFNSLPENKEKFYKYILGMDMTPSEENKILNILKLISSNSNFIDLTSKIITTDHDNRSTELNKNLPMQVESTENALEDKKTTYTELQGIHLLDHLNSIRIFIETFTLTPAGYRRAKSTRLQYNSSLSLTYFIQYDMTFKPIKQINTKPSRETKFLRTCAKKQVGQVVNFNSEGIYNISRHNIKKNLVLRFKVFVKHCNQKVPTELGFGSVNISDITSITNLSSIQCITIMNKGIKIGELKVIIELGCDFIHFGKECIDAVISKKENFSISNKKILTNLNDNHQYKTATGTHSSKSNRKVSSTRQLERLTNNNNKNIIVAKDIAEHQEKSLDNKKIDVCSIESDTEDKISLHGLIYVAEGRDLSESNTYLICRAFWREDKAISQVCNNTTNPFYHFFQLIPLIHGPELLERVKDNYIIVEVYNQQNSGTDNLLGIAKLPVHQLYDVYSDPLGLPHLLLSKYPVISVDDWVNINDPVSGKLCGKLLALVALGTAEQISLLEVSRGLKNISEISRMDHSYRYVSDNTNNATSGQENLQFNVPEVSNFNSEGSIRSNNFAYHVYNVSNQDSASNYKTQESQTNITNLKDTSSEKPTQEPVPSEQLTLRTLVDCLTNVLHNNKNNQLSQSTQIEANRVDEEETHKKLCLNMLDSNSFTDVNDSCNPKNDLRLPTEMYRSVGVGAEYVEDSDQQQNNVYNNPSNSSLTERSIQEIKSNINNPFFRSIVEIECALHLPMIEESNKLIEPSTYITFKNVTNNLDSTDELNSYIATNVFPYSCNPKWNWRCDVKLSTDLLLNNQKRLIFKVWHLINPDACKDINLKRDIVIGFSAIDLSVLMAGFPTVSGWFHIMDFSGKCNGQIKINITPLDNLSPLRKFAPTDTNLSQPTWPHLYNEPNTNAGLNVCEKLSNANKNDDECVQNCKLNVDNGLEDVSMSFLSLSLKKKLTELNEITQRLQSRLRDVTNTAFDDEFDNDFDIVDLNSENENINDGSIETTQYLQSTVSEYSNNEISQLPRQYEIQKNDQNIYDEKQTTSITSSNSNVQCESMYNKNTAPSSKATDIEYLNSNKHLNQRPDCYHNQYQNQHSSMHNYLSNSNAEYPVQGTKAHINHLLDKLSFLPPRSSSEVTLPIRKSILELFTSLRERKNHLQDKKQDKNGRDIGTSTMLVQSDNQQDVSSNTTDFTSKPIAGGNISVESSRNKISTLILEELVTEENDDSATCDELTTYLITSAVSLEGETVEQLDNRYARNFDMAMHDSNADHSKEKNTLFQNGVQRRNQATVLELDKKELLDLTSSDISEDVDNSIDMTVIYKSGENHLTSAINAESIAAMSLDRSSVQAEVKINNYCSSSSEVSTPGVSRQAPEGGNPVEEVKTSAALKWSNDIQDISPDS